MNIPRYWAHATGEAIDPFGKSFSLKCWRWSDHSLEDAKHQAIESVDQIAGKVRKDEKLDRYSYGERPLREEIIDFIADRQGERIAIITRNAYGALVLNAARVMFVDIDFVKERLIDRLVRLVRGSIGLPALSQEQVHLQNIETWVNQHPQRGIRVYRTYAGLRCMVTNDVFDPNQPSTMEILEDLACDPLYMRLCRGQESFRARLSPKPWRCGVPKPPSRYPWENSEEEQCYRNWQEEYTRESSRFATCKLVGAIGSRWLHPKVELVQSMHDQYACGTENQRLA